MLISHCIIENTHIQLINLLQVTKEIIKIENTVNNIERKKLCYTK